MKISCMSPLSPVLQESSEVYATLERSSIEHEEEATRLVACSNAPRR